MLLKDGGKTIELRIFEKEPMPNMGCRPGVFPDKIVVKQRSHYLDGKDAPHEEVVYVPLMAAEIRKNLFRVRGALCAEIDTNPKQSHVVYWKEQLIELDKAIELIGDGNGGTINRTDCDGTQATPDAIVDPYEAALDATLDDVKQEIIAARKIHPPFNSAHEGAGVAFEEVDEFWDIVKTKQKNRDLPKMKKEATQAAAMFVRCAVEVCDEERGRR